MSSIRIRLLSIINHEEMDSTNFVIAKYLLEKIDVLNTISTKEISEECNVSKASISRFCRKIGYEDFQELQYGFITFDPGFANKYRMKTKKPEEEIIHTYLSNVHSAVSNLEETLDFDLLNELVIDMQKYDRVVLMGQVQSSFPAFSLQNDLTSLGKFMYCTENMLEQEKMLKESTEQDLIIVFSAGGRFFERTLSNMKVMNRLNLPKIYFITCNLKYKYEFVYRHIALEKEYGFTSQITLSMYANLITLHYRTLNPVS